MSDKKISALTAATTPLAGTEALPIVQGGVTVKVSAANLTAGRNISATGLTTEGATALGLGVNGGIDAVTITAAKDVGVGTATPTAGAMSNAAILNAGVFTTFKGSAASTSGAATTIAVANQNHPQAVYIVSCGVSSGAPAAYSAVSIVTADNNTLKATALQTATNMTISVSGTNIQATQTSGGAQSILFSIVRVA
jgi:hypothetical protein